MKRLNVLLGNSERRIHKLIEIMLRDVCYNHAVVHIAATGRMDEFARLARDTVKAGRDAYIFMINGAKVRAPAAALALQERLGI